MNLRESNPHTDVAAPPDPIGRRRFLAESLFIAETLRFGSASMLAWPLLCSNATAAGPKQKDSASLADRKLGLLLGSFIGDALGGPIEFGARESVQGLTTDARNWPDDKLLTPDLLEQLSSPLEMQGYDGLRPEPAAYGQWPRNAPAGTVTDDSRHKIILQRAIRKALLQSRFPSDQDIARSFLEFSCIEGRPDSPAIQKLNDEGFREYRFASRWLLGERDLDRARPLSRLWAGVNNCSGQMMFPGLAVAFAGAPEAAYRATYDLDFIDAPIAKDICCGLVAGLASLLGQSGEALSETDDRRRRIDRFESTLRDVDPFQYQQVPFAGRQLNRWLDTADRLVDKAGGSPKRLFELLETDGKPVFWWDAHFTLLVPLSILKLCNYEPMAAMHLTLDFGHDTDSYAQVLGAIVGALDGVGVFPNVWRENVVQRLEADYGENLQAWCDDLLHLAEQNLIHQNPNLQNLNR